MDYFFDTYAIIEIIKENTKYEKYKEEIIVTSILNLGELYYSLLKQYGEEAASLWYKKLENTTLPIDSDAVIDAMQFKFIHRKLSLSFIDCVGYILAKRHGLQFLTGDKAFKNIENVEFVD